MSGNQEYRKMNRQADRRGYGTMAVDVTFDDALLFGRRGIVIIFERGLHPTRRGEAVMVPIGMDLMPSFFDDINGHRDHGVILNAARRLMRVKMQTHLYKDLARIATRLEQENQEQVK